MLIDMPSRPADLSLRDLVLTQLRTPPVLAEYIRMYDNCPIGHRNKNYPWMLSVMSKHIRQHREGRLRIEIVKHQHEPFMGSTVNTKVGRTSHVSAAFAGHGKGARRRGKDRSASSRRPYGSRGSRDSRNLNRSRSSRDHKRCDKGRQADTESPDHVQVWYVRD